MDRLFAGSLRHLQHANAPTKLRRVCRVGSNGLRAAGVTLLNQSVLLRGVNDSASDLRELSLALHRAGVLPYYLHLPDKVAGTAHFDVTAEQGRFLITRLRNQLPGYLVPRLVREVPGGEAKSLIA